MAGSSTESIIASRSVWLAVMEIARHTDMSLAEMVAGIRVRHADFETQSFLALRLKLIRGVLRGLEQETAEKIEGSSEKVEEADVEIDLTAAEIIYLDLSIRVADFKGALTFKKNLWRALTAILGRKS